MGVRVPPGLQMKAMANKGLRSETMRIINVSKEFLGGVRSEMKKVTWTRKQDLIASTGVVIVVTAGVAVVVGVVDKLFEVFLLHPAKGLIPFLTGLGGG